MKTALEIALDFSERFQNNYPKEPLITMMVDLQKDIEAYAEQFQDPKLQENNHTYGYEGKNGYFGTQAGFNKIEPQEEPKELQPDFEALVTKYEGYFSNESLIKAIWKDYVLPLQQKIEAIELENSDKDKIIQIMQTEIDNLDRIIKNF